MLEQLTIKRQEDEIGLDQGALYARGLEHVREVSRKIWTDLNIHDPGITALELLCYALTELGYRSTFPIEDLLASGGETTHDTLFTPRPILSNRPVTKLDYRKVVIDCKGVRNAWLEPYPVTLYADPVQKGLVQTMPSHPGVREVAIRGLYRVLLDFTDISDPSESPDAVIARVRERLQSNRQLCEDLVDVVEVPNQEFAVCAELELAPDADVTEVHAQLFARTQAYFSPPVRNYSLSEMLARPKADGSLFTVEEIFSGPSLTLGFIDDDELANAELRTEIRLSDVIAIIMDIDGVRAVRDILITPAGQSTPLADKWVVSVETGKRAVLSSNLALSRVISYKRGMPIRPPMADVETRFDQLSAVLAHKNETPIAAQEMDLPAPVGARRATGQYLSVQNHFPAIYGIGPDGFPSGADDARKGQVFQLKAYLLFFDQIMADYCQQLLRVKDLFATDLGFEQTYFHQVVQTFDAWEHIYAKQDGTAGPTTKADALHVLEQNVGSSIASASISLDRRNRFLDHLIARFAERFHDYVAVTASSLGTTPSQAIDTKCRFLQAYPAISGDRGLAYDRSQAVTWDTANVSGLEKRIARLLGMPDAIRHDLGAPGEDAEGMLLIENILLRLPDFDDPLLAICADATCVDCSSDDPYSYRIHVILPAYAGRFSNIDFRRFAEEVIREETPAHIMPKICWVDEATMHLVETAYRGWLDAVADSLPARAAKLKVLFEALAQAHSVYPQAALKSCEAEDKFILGKTRLGSEGT